MPSVRARLEDKLNILMAASSHHHQPMSLLKTLAVLPRIPQVDYRWIYRSSAHTLAKEGHPAVMSAEQMSAQGIFLKNTSHEVPKQMSA